VAKFGKWVIKLRSWAAKSGVATLGRCVAKLGRWVAKLQMEMGAKLQIEMGG
jgi:hypothetical protein